MELADLRAFARIDRSSRHLRLTDAGALFRPHSVRILADIDEAGTALDNFVGVPRGTLRVSAPFTFAVALVSPMVPAFVARYPEVRVVLVVEIGSSTCRWKMPISSFESVCYPIAT